MAAPKRRTGGTEPLTITVDGVQVRPREAMWVVFNPSGDPVQAFPSDTTTRGDLARAARSAWSGSTEAILALNEGYHIELMTMRRFIADWAADLKPEN